MKQLVITPQVAIVGEVKFTCSENTGCRVFNDNELIASIEGNFLVVDVVQSVACGYWFVSEFRISPDRKLMVLA